MDHSNALRIDSHSRQWGGQGFAPDERRKRRVLKLQALYAALKDGDLNGARHAFVALINTDPALNGGRRMVCVRLAAHRLFRLKTLKA